MKLFDILTKKEFNNGKEPIKLWHKVGVIKITDKGRWYLQMFHQPETDFYIFEHEQGEKLPEIQIGEEQEA